MTEKNYSTDVVIIGAGPAGLFAIFECGMLKMKCHVVDSLEEVGGQCTALYPEKQIYDIPAHPNLLARELIEKLEEQAKPFDPTFHLNQSVENIEKTDDGYKVTTAKDTVINCKAVIVAAGAGAFGPNRPLLENLEGYEGKSVFYMVKRKEDFANKTIVIAGGGDSAVDWAISLSDIARQIYFVHRRDKLRAAPERVTQLESIENVEMVIPYQLDKLIGGAGNLESVEVKDMDGNIKSIEADRLLLFFGMAPKLGAINNWGLEIEQNHIKVDLTTMQSNIKEIFAIGDIATYPNKLKLILTGFSEAAMAAHAIYPLVYPNEKLHFQYSTTKGVKN